MRKERIKHLIIFIILILIDQLSKYWVRTELVKKESIVLIPETLKLQYHTNTGAVWGILSGKVAYLSIFTFIVLVLIVYLYFRVPYGKKFSVLKTIMVFIMAGAVGNLIDRVFLGHVIDFIYIELINFPLFNFADCCLTVSSILLFILAVFYFKDDDFAFIDEIFRRKKKVASDDSVNTDSASDESDSTGEAAMDSKDTDEEDKDNISK